jgi:hypothetical protein
VQFPHQHGFPYRRAVLVCVIVLCMSAGVLWPGQTISARGTVLAYGALAIASSYAFWRIVLTALAALAENRFPRFALWYIYFVFYGGIFATVVGLLALPFQWKLLDQEEVSGPMFLASLPAGLITAAGALRVLNRYYVEV